MMIHLLRHGRTYANEKGLYYGSTDLPLSEGGIAELAALKTSLRFPTAEKYVTSGLRRAMETLRILYGREPDRKIPELNEFDFGEFEMKSHEELKILPDYLRWISGDENSSCPNGESKSRFVERILRGFEIVCGSEADDVVVVCHGGVIGTLMETFFPGQKEHEYAWIPDCGRGYSIEITGGRPNRYQRIG